MTQVLRLACLFLICMQGEVEDPLTEAFKDLRRKLFAWDGEELNRFVPATNLVRVIRPCTGTRRYNVVEFLSRRLVTNRAFGVFKALFGGYKVSRNEWHCHRCSFVLCIEDSTGKHTWYVWFLIYRCTPNMYRIMLDMIF